jgi:hypothetical protein
MAAPAASPKMGASVIGFDSAWTDNPTAPGAVCILRSAAYRWNF